MWDVARIAVVYKKTQSVSSNETTECMEIEGNFEGKIIKVEEGKIFVEVITINAGKSLSGEIEVDLTDPLEMIVGDEIIVYYVNLENNKVESVLIEYVDNDTVIKNEVDAKIENF